MEAETRKQLIEDYKITFSSEQGKRVLDDLKEFCHFMEHCFEPESPTGTAFRLGERNVILRILAVLEARNG